MNKHKVLLASPFFFPEKISTGKYNTYLAEELVNRNIEVQVVSSYPIYPDWEPKKSNDQLLGMTIYRGGGWLFYPKSTLLRRAVLELWYAWHAVSTYIRLKTKPTHLVAIFPPSLFFLALKLFTHRSVKKIGIVHDLQGVYASQSKGLLGQIVYAAIHAVEKQCFKSCDRLVFLSSSMKERAIHEYMLDDTKCIVCYPFVALPSQELSMGVALSDIFDDEKLHVVYAGALGDKQNPDGLVDFFCSLSKVRSDIFCHIFSAGPHFERLRKDHEALDATKFHDLVDSEHINELYARSDIQIIPQADGTGDGSLPSKLPNLMAAGTPIFAICEKGSELADLVYEAGAGGVSNTWDIDSVVLNFMDILPQVLEEERSVRASRLRCFVEEKFSIYQLVDKIIEV